MMAGSSTRSSLAAPNHELISIVHKRPWDPLSGGILRYRPRKLPKDPILVMVPSGPGSGNTSHSRTHHWMSNLSALGTVVCVYSTPGRMMGKVSVANCMDHMLSSTRAKVTELHSDYGDKPIVLVGVGSGAALACQVALVENVTAVVCLGFHLYTVEDNRGTPDDSLLNVQVPLLFVIGQNASTCSMDALEDLREKLNVETSMVMVGGADDQLRLTKAKKKLDKVTQSMVDKCIMDEVADFLGTLLSPGYMPPVRPTVAHSIEPPPRRTVERKRKCDMIVPTGPEALPPVPAKKGRKPKISMMQKMVQNKWANQMSQAGELPRSPVSITSTVATTPTSQSVMVTGRVVENKGLQFTSLQRPVGSAAASSSESTITVVAASSPTLTAATAVKSRLTKGQLTSLTSLVQPGTKGVRLSPGTRSVEDEMKINTTPDLGEELNILDMPVILGDQNPEDPILSQSLQTSPVKFILTSAKPRPTVKLVGQPTATKIFISKAETATGKTVYLGTGSGRAKPRIRHIPATKHSAEFY
uniref:KANL3/Tex30 alpha/beta hydrolase-like domain-containing protein n=1 Tax=Homalodisca liturata TaxID=320908 RepID=A0A1B6IAA1_9HEMI